MLKKKGSFAQKKWFSYQNNLHTLGSNKFQNVCRLKNYV